MRVWTKAGAQPGDVLYLTKPLGTGLLVHGQKEGRTDPAHLAEATRWMQVLNAGAADALRAFEPNAVTDVTGFGLLGHAYELAERSGVAVRARRSALPALPGALELAASGRPHRRRQPQPRLRGRGRHGRRRERRAGRAGVRPADRGRTADLAPGGARRRASSRPLPRGTSSPHESAALPRAPGVSLSG